MPKQILYKVRSSTKQIRNQIRFYYMEKFFNKWMNKYDYPELNYQQKHYIMKKFWASGSIACSSIENADESLAGLMINGEIDMKENQIIFTPWAFAERYNIYDFPTHITLINTRGVKFITPKVLEVDKDAVIIYAQKNHKSVYSSIEAKLEELIDIEMKIRSARKAQSQAFLFAFSPEDYEQAKSMSEQLENDEPYIFMPLNEVDKAKGLASGSPYINDKLEAQRQKVENDILTMIGVNNVGVAEKKEHLVVDEINANNEDIEQQSQSFTDEITEGFDRVYKVFDFKVNVIDKYQEFKENEEKENQDYESSNVEE